MEAQAALIGAPAIGAVDERAETGGFAVAADDTALAHRRRADPLSGLARRSRRVRAPRPDVEGRGTVTLP